MYISGAILSNLIQAHKGDNFNRRYGLHRHKVPDTNMAYVIMGTGRHRHFAVCSRGPSVQNFPGDYVMRLFGKGLSCLEDLPRDFRSVKRRKFAFNFTSIMGIAPR
jgi:hypothetical protein